jgi:putative addiction module component (TIGR02574 family)
MTPDEQRILNEALQLPPEERSDLAARLIQSLDEGEGSVSSKEFDESLLREAELRLQEIDAGQAKTLTWPEIRRRVMSSINGASAA